MNDYLETRELYHHGIKGQKWGVRRFQNEDGTLTEAGKKHSTDISIGNNLTLRERKKSVIAKALGKVSPKIKEQQDRTKDYAIILNDKRIGDVETFLESKKSLNITWLGIDPKQRGHHYASTVMDYIIKDSKDKGLHQITLEVPGASPDARHIYEKKGFVAGKQISDDNIWEGLTSMKKNLK